MAAAQVSRYIRFVAEMPMTITCKAQKFVMREQMVADLGLAEARAA